MQRAWEWTSKVCSGGELRVRTHTHTPTPVNMSYCCPMVPPHPVMETPGVRTRTYSVLTIWEYKPVSFTKQPGESNRMSHSEMYPTHWRPLESQECNVDPQLHIYGIHVGPKNNPDTLKRFGWHKGHIFMCSCMFIVAFLKAINAVLVSSRAENTYIYIYIS